MGNTYSYQKQISQALIKRQKQLNEQLIIAKQSFEKFGITSEKAQEICTLNVHEVVEKLNNNQLTSQEVLAALIYRCVYVGEELNFLATTNFSWALKAARECDQQRRQTRKKNWTLEQGEYDQQKHFPPLFGIPISLKDVFDLESTPTTFGLCARTNNYKPDSPLVKCFKNSGMIPFIKTNVPQFCMSSETNNNLWGRTFNPWNKERVVGGSSGGQGAIISARCSLIGVGSDIGGSIRAPSIHCGLFSLKPHSKRISNTYSSFFSKAFESFSKTIPLCLGPLGKSAKDLALFMDVATHSQFYQGQEDAYTKIIPFNWKQYNQVEKAAKKYRIGFIKSLKDIEPSLATQRALQQIIDLLKAQGHQIIDVQIPNEREVIREFFGELYASKSECYREFLKGQKPIPELVGLFKTGEMWWYNRIIIQTMTKIWTPRIYFYFFEKGFYSKVIEYQRHIGQIQELKNKWIKYWKQKQLDFVIAPGVGCQAFQHGKSENVTMACFYTLIWNPLDVAVGTLPVTVVQQNEQHYESRFKDSITQQLKQVAKGSKGLPVGIQIVGLPYKQQRVLGFMSYLEKKINFYQKHPLPQI